MPPVPRLDQQFRFMLGGRDLEMIAIRDLVRDTRGDDAIIDKGLAWGARATDYEADIRAALAINLTPVLVELAEPEKLAADVPQERLCIVDHHGAAAGVDKPCSLRQVFALLRLPAEQWTSDMTLIEANDIGHIRRLREIGATPDEIVSTRDRDRAAQGVSEETERLSRLAIASREQAGTVTIITTEAATSSAISDFIEPEFGGPGADNLVVLMPRTISFSGRGALVERLIAENVRGAWSGGALPERGFWGVNLADGPERRRLVALILAAAPGTPR